MLYMLKFIRYFALLSLPFLGMLTFAQLTVGADTQAGNSPWISLADLSLQKISDVGQPDIPSTFFNSGNIDCLSTDDGRCAINTNYGLVDNSSLSINNKWYPVLDSGGNSANFFGIPGSTTALTSSLGPVFGSYLYFTSDTYSALAPKYKTGLGGTTINGINNLLLDHFQLNRAPDARLQDKTGTRLAADLNSLAFSGNSEWMVVTDPNITTLRVNVTNGAVLPFGRIFTYGSGQNPRPKNAISSDGRYAVIASQDTSSFSIYDLSTCGGASDSVKGPVACQSRDLFSDNFISTHIPGYGGIQYIRFLDDNTISFYASYKENNVTKYAQYVLSTDLSPVNRQQYLALGDSYISGEGTFDYIEGTDTANDTCHVSLKSYPYLIGKQLSYDSYHSVACSGATTNDIINTSLSYIGQADRSEKISRALLDGNDLTLGYLSSFLPGHLDQLDYVSIYRPKTMTVSIGGNDMHFSDILKICVSPSTTNPTCYSTYEERFELINLINNTVFPNIVNTYSALKHASPADTRIYAIGYPQIAEPGGDCAINVELNNDELIFSQQLISYLDSTIQQAAAKAGVYYVDTQNALDGHRLCEAGSGDAAVNGLTAGNDIPSHIAGPIGRESYHPNVLGHSLLSNTVLNGTDNLTRPMPAPNLASAPPSELGQEILNAPHSGRPINKTEYDPGMSADLAYRGTAVDVSVNGANHSLASGATFKAELHSDPISLGSYQTAVGGGISAQITIPATAPTGYHVLHLYGQDVTGQPVDIYKMIYIANTADDLDGNGILDSSEPCVGVPASGRDFDQDKIDDACDANITLPPAQPPSVSLSPSSSQSAAASATVSASRQPDISSGSSPVQDLDLADPSSQILVSSDPAVQPSVLAANTTAASPKSKNLASVNGNKNSNSYLGIGGASACLLSLVGFFAKRWLS